MDRLSRLDPLDRRVYEMAVSRAPLAQIAVQLGVTVSQAEERIERVCARLGGPDRAALREWAANGTEDEEKEPEAAAQPAPPPPSTGRYSRRAFLATAGAAGLAVAGGGALAWKLWGADSGDSQVAPPGTPATTVTVTSDSPEGIISDASFKDTWEVRTFARGELIDWPHGLFLMGAVGGEVRGHRLKTDRGSEYRTWPGGRFVSAIDSSAAPVAHLMDLLNAETSWSWPHLQFGLIAVAGRLADATLVFERREAHKGTGELTLLRMPQPGAGIEPLATVTVPPTGFSTPVLISPDGGALAVASGGGPRLVVTLLDAATGKVRGTYDTVLTTGASDAGFSLEMFQPLDGGESFLLDWHLFAMQFRWDGSGSTTPLIHDHAASFSTDGRLYLREIPLRSAGADSADGPREYWPAVEIVELASGKVLSRVRSASIYYGDWAPARRWMAPDAFTCLLRTAGAENGYDFGVISTRRASGTWNVMQRYAYVLSADPALDGMWFQSPWVQGVIPGPEGTDLVALGKWGVLNTRDGNIVRANVRTEEGPAHIDPWAAGPNWLTFALPHGGHGGASPPVLLQPRFESADTPIESPLRFKVSAQGDRLNLRDQPSLAGVIVTTLEDGSALTQAETSERPAGRRGLAQGKDGTWVYVRTPGGLEGWVNSAYLAWP